MSLSPLKVRLTQPLRHVRIRAGADSFVCANQFRAMIEERYREGYEAGQKALAEQLVAQRKQLIDIQSGLLRSIQAALPAVVADCEQSVVLLALESARKIVASIPVTAEMMEAVVQNALAELQDTAEYEVFLHPEDLALLEQVSSGLLPNAHTSKVRFAPDSSITRGGCSIKTRHGSITALRERMFDKLQAAVLA